MQTGHWEAERKGTGPCVRVAKKCLSERGTSKLTPKGDENSLHVSERGKWKSEEGRPHVKSQECKKLMDVNVLV